MHLKPAPDQASAAAGAHRKPRLRQPATCKRPDFGLCFTYPAHVLCVAGRVKHPPLQGHSPGESPRQSGLVPRHGARAPEASGPVPLRAKARDSAALRR